MVFLTLVKIKNLMKINPFLILGITKNATPAQTKLNFRQKLIDARNNDELRAKVCLSYDIIVNKTYYYECEENTYKINDSINNVGIALYYYCVIGDSASIYNIIENEPKLLFYKDPLKRSLLYIAARNGHVNICDYLINKGIDVNEIQGTGSTPLHGAAYYGQTNVVNLLINYGAKTNIKNEYNHYPIDEAMTKEIKDLLKKSEEDPIINLYKSLLSKNIAKSLIPISYKGNIVSKKLICKINNLPKQYKIKEVIDDWIPAWHGTKFTSLESIAEIGLKPAGGILKNGKELQVCVRHIGRKVVINKIQDWANGIFVSPSIFYCSHPAYAKEIISNNEQWKIFVEVRVKPNSFIVHESTCPKYVPKNGEPKMLEYRIPAENEGDVQVVSLTFVKSEFFGKVNNYSEGQFLRINNNQIY